MKYSCKSSLFRSASAYDLRADRLVRRGPATTVDIPFSDISEIVLFKERRFGSSRLYQACKIAVGQKTLLLTSAHRISLLQTQDRTGFYSPFIKEFTRLALTSNPSIRFVDGDASWMIDALSLSIGALTRRLPRALASNICGVSARWIGPLLGPHRHALDQLNRLYPTQTPRQKRAILRGMWDGIGRSLSDYGHAYKLLAVSQNRSPGGLVVMDEPTAELVRRMAQDRCGALIFGAHLGNWEIPAGMVGRLTGRDIAATYRRQRSSTAADQLIEVRSQYIGRLIEANHSAPRKILNALRDGWLVSMLVDQHDADGVEVSFFGQMCRVNPLLARMARMRNWPVYGARTVRLAKHKYQVELIGPLQFPRDAYGKIDVQGAMQVVFAVIETWIQEHPEQWMWFRRIAR